MKVKAILLVIISFPLIVCAQPKVEGKGKPKLVVGLVVDQMRWDYLQRFYNRYGDSGFKRLMNHGTNCQNVYINYVPTYTAPGHSSIYTGSVPAMHGISGNYWIDNKQGKKVYCTQDDTARTIGSNTSSGKMSPANLLTTTITDELKLATNFKSKVFGIALKDRGAILPAGHLADGAFWYDDATGSFISSSYYMNNLPLWVKQFNDVHYADTFINKAWELSLPVETYLQSTSDSNNYEKVSTYDGKVTFPHYFKRNKKGSYTALRSSPYGNTMTLAFARQCIKNEQLGQADRTDFLTVSLSSTDYIGHQYGPNSVEVEDTYIKLDAELAEFLKYLDDNVGEGNYLLFLTADHGAAHNANFLNDAHVSAGVVNEATLAISINEVLKKSMGVDSIVLGVLNSQVYLNENVVGSLKIDREILLDTITKICLEQEGILKVINMESCEKQGQADIEKMVFNGHYKQRGGALFFILRSGYYCSNSHKGTTHGSSYSYDTHIPLIWYGWNISTKEINEPLEIVDIASTLSTILNIQQPSGCIGRSIF